MEILLLPQKVLLFNLLQTQKTEQHHAGTRKNPIQKTDNFKFLGMVFKRSLSWTSHLNELNSKMLRMHNLIRTMTAKRINLNTKLLTRIYKAIIQSRTDYGGPILGSCSRNQLNNQILRTILGCLTSTPTQLLYLETGIEPITKRWERLALNYLIKLNSKPWNPAYEVIHGKDRREAPWPQQSCPALQNHIKTATNLDKHLFSEDPTTHIRQCKLPSWKELKADFKYFPGKKREYKENPTAAVLLLREVLDEEDENQVTIYTDGSLRDSAPSSSCAIFIPKENIRQSWNFKCTSNILTAELTAIRMALKTAWPMDYDDINIISVSKSTLQT